MKRVNWKTIGPLIMSGAACTGVVATSILSVKATPKALKLLEEQYGTEPHSALDTVKTCWKLYLPAAGVGLGTIGLIAGSAILNRNAQLSMAGAATLASQYFRDYKQAVDEVVTPEQQKEIRKKVATNKYEDASFVDTKLIGVPSEEKALFYDPWGNRYFEALTEDVRNAEYHANRNFALTGAVSVNDFFDFLNLERIDKLDSIGWAVDDEIYWIDFQHDHCVLDDGMECYILGARFEPVPGFIYGYWDAMNQEKELLDNGYLQAMDS